MTLRQRIEQQAERELLASWFEMLNHIDECAYCGSSTCKHARGVWTRGVAVMNNGEANPVATTLARTRAA